MESIITAIIGALVPIIVFYLQRKRDNKRYDAELSERYQKIALQESKHRVELEQRLNEKIVELQSQVEEQKEEIEDLRGWAERLVKQVRDLGGTPIEFVPRRRGDEV